MAARSSRQSKIEFVHWFRSTSENDTNTLRIFSMDKGYYAVFGKQNSEYIANDIDGIPGNVQYYPKIDEENEMDKNDYIECIYFKHAHKHSIITNYISKQHKNVHIYIRNKQSNGWTIAEKRSPNNYSTGASEEAAFNFIAIIMQIKQNIKHLGICLYNHSTNKFEISQFIEDDRYTKIASLFAAKGVKQCIFKCKSNIKTYQIEIDNFKQILQTNNIRLLDTNNNKFWSFIKNNSENSMMATINNIINKTSKKSLLTFTNHMLAFEATCGVIFHEELNQNEENFGRFNLIEYQIDCFMRLDTAAQNALNLFPTADNRMTNKNSSLYGIFANACLSTMGERELSTWIRQPLVDIKQIHRRQKLIKLFVENEEIRCTLREEHMKRLVDLERICTRLINNKGTLKELVDCYTFFVEIPFIRERLMQVKDVQFDVNDNYKPINVLQNEFIAPIMEIENSFNNFQAMIEQIVDLNKVPRDYLIRHDFAARLHGLQQKKDACWKKMEKEKANAKVDLDIVKDNDITLYKNAKRNCDNDKKHCLRVKKDKKLNGKIEADSHYKKIPTQKKAFYFTTKKLKKLSKEYTEYEKAYMKRQNSIVEKTIEIAKTYYSVIDATAKIFTELDVILSFAHIAGRSVSNYTLPKMHKRGNNRFIKMENARHPCLELIRLEDMGGVIGNGVEMIENKSSFQIVTGPNMGGKSTYIRMIGLIVVMAQIGSYVPCDACELTVFDSILARVGASDNCLRGVSTFMAEMLETRKIVEGASNNSLVIIDELGRGTSTYDGYGIADSISAYIIDKIKAFGLFATHFHELAALASEYDCVVNRHVNAIVSSNNNNNNGKVLKSKRLKPMVGNDMEDNELSMEYKIRKGPCPQSFGIEVAKIAKFPMSVVRMANDKVIELESKKNTTISLLTFESLKQIMERYNGIVRKVGRNNWKKDDEMYENEIEGLLEFIHSKIDNDDDGNEELDDMCVKISEEIDGNNSCNNNGNDKMEID